MTITPDMQNTIFGELVPTAPHKNDLIDCSDDTVCRHEDTHYDVKGGAHSDADDRLAANVAIVEEILNGVDEWSCDYHTGNGDYPDGYDYIVHEESPNWPDKVREWVENEYDEFVNSEFANEHSDYMDKLVEHICEGIDDFDVEYNSSNYDCYSGDACCLYSLDIGECEEQIDINCYPELKALHDLRELDDVLDRVNTDCYISRSHKREKNEKTGYYENVGRETYMPYEHSADHPTVELYTMPGGIWHFIVPAERMKELVSEFLEERNNSDE